VKLKTKVSLSISLLVFVVVLAVSVLYLNSFVDGQIQIINGHAQFISEEVYDQLRSELMNASEAGTVDLASNEQVRQFLHSLNDSRSFNALLGSAISYPATSSIRDVALVDSEGVVAADSNPLLVGQQLPSRPALEQLVDATWWQQVSAIFGRERVYEVVQPLLITPSVALPTATRSAGAIRVGLDTVLVYSALANQIKSIIRWGVLIIFVAVLLSIAFSDFVLSPLTAISAQLDRLTGGNAEAEERVTTRDEYGVVSSKIQQLGRQIQDVRQVYTTLQENVIHVLESLEEGVLLFDSSGRAMMASAAAQRFLGLEPADLLRRSAEDIFPTESSLDRAVRWALRSHQPLGTREVERRPGERTLLARIDILGDSSRFMGALLTLRDAERVHRLEDELEVARRVSAIGNLTRGVAHEVKNPLNAMAIHLDLLLSKARNGSAANIEPHVEVIRREIERLDRVVRTFLDFTRPVELNFSNADLVEAARSVRELALAAAASHAIDIRVESSEPEVRAWVDRDLIEQAVLNLVNNGIEAMAHDPRLGDGDGLSAGKSAPGRALTLQVSREGEDAVIRVCDQGPGVPADLREKIFDLYFSTRPEGSGIGLALTARVMQLHKGAVELESSTSEGSTFMLRFPLALRREVEVV
jgi:signal transduction histidine kinase